ncbi:CPBP family intramembrane metalloprotease [Chitinophagaceae bacterium LB-8]|uniref:CPBP family intramembrane metalloprotease n=1 Tax=Paraflavisolibacter caeni TaxID=2982496 RepID=A0A9X2XYJ6_9BACT|nr:CPBP family intramembrane metalloprotease [Paraflavisolibacter caeni]MCU7551929.1 CPBP family intramembrane metalloprotease [Paraflavisolibacter caeni]
MKKILEHLKEYYFFLEKRVFILSALFISILIFINYYHNLNKIITTYSYDKQFYCWYIVFTAAFSFPYILTLFFKRQFKLLNSKFILLLLIAPLIFSWKMVYKPEFHFTTNNILNDYWNQVAYWPFKLIVMVTILLITWQVFNREQHFYGIKSKNIQWRPYWVMLLIMAPLISSAATQSDFLTVYPKFQQVLFLSQPQSSGWHQLLYELSYGTDFISIELFFRGFLILAFAHWAGKDAILPMALFYCTIHFGKPLGECISSFFGGIILGVVTFNTRTIWGGLMVHLGIAWMMELAGYIAK